LCAARLGRTREQRCDCTCRDLSQQGHHALRRIRARRSGRHRARLVAREMAVISDSDGHRESSYPKPASATVAKAKPDGYTLVMQGNGTALSTALFKSLPYDLLKDSRMCRRLRSRSGPDRRSAIGVQDCRNLLAAMKANPGKLNVGTVRLGSTQNLAAEMFKSMRVSTWLSCPTNRLATS